jgi:hypothetical protein
MLAASMGFQVDRTDAAKGALKQCAFAAICFESFESTR